ncbi:MAG: VWA domain-containing protein [Acidobacteria bacterium]|nr:VWA domain-containing protein [Acidobacteriota bacterium]
MKKPGQLVVIFAGIVLLTSLLPFRAAAQLPSGGPSRGVGETVIVPKPKAPEPAPRREKPPNPDETFQIRTEVNEANISVVVQEKGGMFIPGLKKENFKLEEDGVVQTIKRVSAGEAPMTVVLVMEFSSKYYEFLYDTFTAAFGFVNSLKPEDWIAIMIYDLRTDILLDFTKNKAAALGTLQTLNQPGFSESNLFDAVSEAVERMHDIDGKKAIVLISSGEDTFSRKRYDAVLKQVQASDTPIYAIGTGQAVRLYYEGRGAIDSPTSIGFLQADNQLRTFSRMSGGKAYLPRFEGEFPGIFGDISAALRNEYVLSYSPTNTSKDGKLRKIKVTLVDVDGKPLKIVDEKRKELKYEVRAREGYTAPREVD